MKMDDFFLVLGSQNLSHLEKKSGISRQALHNALKTHNMKLDNLQSVAKAMQYKLEFSPLKTERNLLGSLSRYGVPVAHSREGTLTFAETVGESLLRSRQDAAYETFVPFLLAENPNLVEPLKLAAKAFELNQVNALGYFVEMAHTFRPFQVFEKLLSLLSPAKSLEKEFLVVSEKTHFPELFEKNELALKWNLRVRGTVQNHLQRWEKWAQSQKTK